MAKYTATFRLESEFNFDDPFYTDILLTNIKSFIDDQVSNAVTVTIETGSESDH